MKILGAAGQKIKRRTNVRRKANPKATRVARCVRHLTRDIKAGRKRPVRSVHAVCTAATGQRYRRRAKAKPGAAKRRTNPLPFNVSFKTGPAIAQFRSLPRAAQYARALADRSRRAVRVYQ